MNIDDDIDDVINSYVAETKKDKPLEKIELEKVEEFKKEFSEKVHTVILPIFKEIKTKLNLQNIRCDILDKIQGSIVTEIKLDIHPYIDTSSAQDKHPSMTFFIDEPNKVTLYMQKMSQEGGSAGRDGAFSLEEITSDLVKQKILDLLNFCFARKF